MGYQVSDLMSFIACMAGRRRGGNKRRLYRIISYIRTVELASDWLIADLGTVMEDMMSCVLL